MTIDEPEYRDPTALLQARGISKSFSGVPALDGVNLAVRGGMLHAVVGENGAGKSTLMNILAGVFPPDAGELNLAGLPIRYRNPREAQDAGVAIIFQELQLVPNLSVAENIFLGREPRTRLGLIDYRKLHADARTLLARLNAEIDAAERVERLRVGSQQLVEIAKALSLDARVLIMDEPTSAISEHEIESLNQIIEQLKQRGVAILYITHKLDELDRIADEVTVLRDGRLVATKPFHDVTRDELVRMMVGRELAPRHRDSKPNVTDELLRVEQISLCHPQRPDDYLVRDVSFAVHRGEVLGIFGLMGAGRTELLQSLFGLHPHAATGAIFVDGKKVSIRSPQDAIRAGIALAPEDRKTEGLVLEMSVVENAGLASLDRTTRWGLLQPRREREFVGTFIDRLRVKTPSLRAKVNKLSGGNQQKVVLSKWLATDPKILLLDEPTRGVDVGAKQELYAAIEELARGGLAVVVVSSELLEILTLADRILVLVEGRVTAQFRRDEASEESVLHAALPAGKRTRLGSA